MHGLTGGGWKRGNLRHRASPLPSQSEPDKINRPFTPLVRLPLAGRLPVQTRGRADRRARAKPQGWTARITRARCRVGSAGVGITGPVGSRFSLSLCRGVQKRAGSRSNGASPQPDKACRPSLPIRGQAHAGTRGQWADRHHSLRR